MGNDYYSYKSESYYCKHCGWSGLGSEVEQGETFADGFEVNCPKCGERFPGLILFPTIDETLEKGSEIDKYAALATKSFQDRWQSSLLKDINQLPDIDSKPIAFILKEEEENGERYIIVTADGITIWKEICAYEYYDRFVDLGNLLKQKYRSKMIDLIPEVDGLYLYGDRLTAPGIIESFRAQLRKS
jgi:hypothetical protein